MSEHRHSEPPLTDEALEAWLDRTILRRPPNILDTLVAYTRHDNPEIRSTAAYGLGEVDDERAVETLLKVVSEDNDENVRDEALRALDTYRDPRILDALIREVGREKRSRPPRQVVARQLRHYPSDRTVAALRELLNDEDEFVSSDAADSLRLVLAELESRRS